MDQNQTPNPIGSLSEKITEITGLSRHYQDEIFQLVKNNHRRLDSCPGPHDFSIVERQTGQLIRSWKCSKCGGVVEEIFKRWYTIGLEHGRKFPT